MRPVRPDYYKFTIDGQWYQVIDIIDEKELSYHLGTVLAYILRAGHKHETSYKEDLQKAYTHLKFQLNKMKRMGIEKICILPHPIFTFENINQYYNLAPEIFKIGQNIYDNVFLSQESLNESLLLLKEYIHDS